MLASLFSIVSNIWSCNFFLSSQAVAEMAAIGFGLPKDAFTSLMQQVYMTSTGDQ